ncbi:MAG: glycosyltransferase family 2 protein [Candidatus Berkelbacteria bacterium]|nr:glycosyltransferase family 2 protein [Candidatus Berkelbacteria bacterium]
MTEPRTLSVVIPAYKEEKRLHKTIEAIEKYKTSHAIQIETIIVVDGSPDRTAEIAKELTSNLDNYRVIDRKQNHGKGYTVREGMLEAKGDYILFTDADNSTPFAQVDKLLKEIDNFEVPIHCEGGRLAQPQPLYRIIGSRALNLVIQLLADRGIKDTQCGFKLFQKVAAKEIFKRLTFERFSFDIELLAIARKLGYRTKEVGIIWYDDPHSTVNPVRDGLRMVTDAWRVRKNIFSGRYK